MPPAPTAPGRPAPESPAPRPQVAPGSDTGGATTMPADHADDAADESEMASHGAHDADSAPLAYPPPDQPQPRLAIEGGPRRELSVWRGEDHAFEWLVKNAGEGPLAIRLKTCCGTRIHGELDRTIPPGGEETVRVTLSGNRPPGRASKNIELRSNDRNNAITQLTAILNVRSALKFEPSPLNFGRVDRDAPALSHTVKIHRGDGGPIAPKLLPISNDALRAELREIQPGEEYELDVVLTPPFPNHSFNSSVGLETGVAQSPRETLSVSAQLVPRLTTMPSYFGVVPGLDEEQRATVQLNWSGGRPARVLNAEASDQAVRVEVGPGESVTITVPPGFEFPPGQPKRVLLTIDDASVPQLTIPIVSTRAVPRPASDGGNQPGGPATPRPPDVQSPRGDARRT